jgi:hypothetical protein
MSGIHRFLTRRDRQKGAGRHGKEEVCVFSHLHLALVFIDGFDISLLRSHIIQNTSTPSMPLLRGFFVSQATKEDSHDHEKKV